MITSVELSTQSNIADYQDNYVTPTSLCTTYNIPKADGYGVKVGIISLGGGWLQSDLDKSMGNLGITQYSNITSITVDGADTTFTGNPYGPDVENTLDIYCIAGMVPRANIVVYSGLNTGTIASTSPYTAYSYNIHSSFANVVNRAIDDGCDVISISWAISEVRIYGNVNFYVGDFLYSALAKAAAKGVSVFVASGDYGASGSVGERYPSVEYPAINSNVTAVGGTTLSCDTNYSRFYEYTNRFSGGGISTIISLPDYQTGLVYKTFDSNTMVTSANISLTARGIPDMSAPYTSYPLWFNGSVIAVGGTSASTPIIAGMVARFVQLSGRRLGCINSTSYKNVSSFYDLFDPNNQGDTVYSYQGYAANAGWDLLSGLGSPIGTSLYSAFNSTLRSQFGSAFPRKNYGFRPARGATYPRSSSGIR
jgi:kumamolisin